jgi:hypothetical protein
MGFSGGYRDTEVQPGVIRIEVRGNTFAGVDTLEEFIHRRAIELCRSRRYGWRLDPGSEPQAPAQGWVRGFITCTDTAQLAWPERFVQIIEVNSGKVAGVPEDTVQDQVLTSFRVALVRDGKVEAVTPEGLRVRVDVAKVEAALTLGYRLLSGAELSKEKKAPARGE